MPGAEITKELSCAPIMCSWWADGDPDRTRFSRPPGFSVAAEAKTVPGVLPRRRRMLPAAWFRLMTAFHARPLLQAINPWLLAETVRAALRAILTTFEAVGLKRTLYFSAFRRLALNIEKQTIPRGNKGGTEQIAGRRHNR